MVALEDLWTFLALNIALELPMYFHEPSQVLTLDLVHIFMLVDNTKNYLSCVVKGQKAKTYLTLLA